MLVAEIVHDIAADARTQLALRALCRDMHTIDVRQYTLHTAERIRHASRAFRAWRRAVYRAPPRVRVVFSSKRIRGDETPILAS